MLSESVSKKFFEDIYSRVEQTCFLFGLRGTLLRDDVMKAFDAYVETGAIPVDAKDRETVMVFTLLLPEIDRAVARSAAARKRAKSRKGISVQKSRSKPSSGSTHRPVKKTTSGKSKTMAATGIVTNGLPIPIAMSDEEFQARQCAEESSCKASAGGILKNRRQRRRELRDQKRREKKRQL